MGIGFVGHGAPTLALDPKKGAEVASVTEAEPTPAAILVVSAHWEEEEPTLGTTEKRPLIYDFYGFPEPLYRVQYPAPGAPDLAERVRGLVPGVRQVDRGLDHGVWAPLIHISPGGKVPVLQLSLAYPGDPRKLFDLGASLAPLSAEGVLLLGSGNVVHNLRAIDFHDRTPPPGWAIEFDAWCEDALVRKDYDLLIDFARRGPGASLAHPTHEHFLPLLLAAGAASAGALAPHFPLTGFEYATIGRRCVVWS